MHKKSNILVTGGAGFMGSSFIRFLLAQKEFEGNVINYDALTYCANLDNLASCKSNSRYSFVQGDICSQQLFKEVLDQYNIDTVVNFAAESHVDRSIESAHVFYETNVMGVLKMLEVIQKEKPKLRFHHISTDEVYGSLENEEYFYETTPYAPNSPYAASKAASDHLCRAFAKTHGLNISVSHSVNNYGPYQFPEKLIPLLISRLSANKSLPIYGDGLQIRDWIYVEDHSKAIYTILQKTKSWSVYNLSARQTLTNLDLVKLLITLFAKKTQKSEEELLNLIEFVEDRKGHDRHYAVDPSKMERQLGFFANTSLIEGLDKTVSWYLSNENWLERILDGSYRNWMERQYSFAK